MPRASPYQRTEEDQRSEAATVGDIDDLGSVASLSSITDAKAFEVNLLTNILYFILILLNSFIFGKEIVIEKIF